MKLYCKVNMRFGINKYQLPEIRPCAGFDGFPVHPRVSFLPPFDWGWRWCMMTKTKQSMGIQHNQPLLTHFPAAPSLSNTGRDRGEHSDQIEGTGTR